MGEGICGDDVFMTANVLAVARLIEAVASKTSERHLRTIMESWRKIIFSFWEENLICDC